MWHPYTEVARIEEHDFPIIEHGEGIYLYDVDGTRYIDAISSWWCCNLGHNHPVLVDAIKQQLGVLQHSILGGMGHVKAIELAEKLSNIAPPGLTRTFFASDGSSAVEAALKIALQYFENIGQPQRKQFISLEHGYHGDTIGTMGVGFVPMFHDAYREIITPSLIAPSPADDERALQSLASMIEQNHETIAAVIVEPLCQAAGGMRLYTIEYLQALRKIANTYGILLIADEIAVGFGRLGAIFACTKAQIAPDIMCIGKGLTGGYLPLSATMVTENIYDAFRKHPLFHSHTFGGNPLASSAALAALQTYEEEGIIEKAIRGESILRAGFSHLPHSRTLGMVSAFEAESKEHANKIGLHARAHGLLLRPIGNVVYVWPPLVATEQELHTIIDILLCLLSKFSS